MSIKCLLLVSASLERIIYIEEIRRNIFRRELMLWGTVLKRKNDIIKNLSEQKLYEEMISALQEDEYVDAYQDSQPGGGNCLNNNYKQRQEYEKQLCSLNNVRLLFPQAYEKDIPILEYFIQKLKVLHRGVGFIENSELTDYVEQAFLFYKYFSSHQMSKNSIDEFCKIGEYVAKHTVKYDSEKESFYRVKPISFDIFYMVN